MLMKCRKTIAWIVVVTIVTGAVSWDHPASAGFFTGTFQGKFTNPQLEGLRYDIDGNLVFEDNSGYAVYSGVGTNTLQWGDGPFDPPNASTVSFTGFSVVNAPSETEIPLGVFYYENGTSLVGTSIFGADFTIWLPEDASVVPLVAKMDILTTSNRGEPLFDADFLSFDKFPDTFHVFESESATAILYGRIVGDPEIELTRLEIQAGEGFVGAGAVPEPGTLSLLGCAALFLGGIRLRSRKVTDAKKSSCP